VERPAYNQYLSKHFSSLDDGFFFRADGHQIKSCCCSTLFASQSHFVSYQILSPVATLLFTGAVVNHEASSHSLTSSIDSDSEVEDSIENTSILLSDTKNKCLVRISYTKGRFHKNKVIRVESPPGILLGWIQRRKRCLSTSVYHLFEETEPIQPSMILRRCSRIELSDDDESHDIGCFVSWLPCGQSSLKSNLYEIHEILVTESKAEDQPTISEKGVGMIFGSQQTDIAMRIGKEERITCSFQPGITYKKKVLILTAVIVIHMNHDIA
jgi:hypothetical protein